MLMLSLFLVACCSNSEDNSESDSNNGGDGLDTNIATIATGGSSGPYNIIATTLSDIYSSNLDINSKTQTTGASVENLNLIKEEKAEMAFVMSDALNQAIEGSENFDEPIDNVEQIGTLYPNFVQVEIGRA